AAQYRGGRGHAAEVDEQEQRGRHGYQRGRADQPQAVEGDQEQAHRGDRGQEPGRRALAAVRGPGQLACHGGGAGDVGIDRAERQDDRRGRGSGRASGTDGAVEQVGQRDGAGRARPEHADGRDGQAQVERRGGGEGDGDHPRQLPGGVGEGGGPRRG